MLTMFSSFMLLSSIAVSIYIIWVLCRLGSFDLENNADLEVPCIRTVQRLENNFNARRKARQGFALKANYLFDERTKYDLFETEAICLSEERFGSKSTARFSAFGDGPKFVCGMNFIRERYLHSNSTCLVYSIGSNNEIEYEQSVSDWLGCETHTFDPTLGSEEFIGSNFSYFHPWGLGRDGETQSPEVYYDKGAGIFPTSSLKSIMSRLDHSGKKIDMLKIDCEGCEWKALPEIFHSISTKELKVDQIQTELHGGNIEEIKSLFKKADEAEMRIMHKERNQWGCDGYRCLEYSFVSEEFLRRVNTWHLCESGNF